VKHFWHWLTDPAKRRPQEGALSALRTPVNPPAPTRLVPLDQTVAPIDYEGAAKHNPGCPCEACVPYLAENRSIAPPPPPPIPGLGRPETTRKEAWWERAITWLLSRGER
jgi:hypothetical protein